MTVGYQRDSGSTTKRNNRKRYYSDFINNLPLINYNIYELKSVAMGSSGRKDMARCFP